MEVKNISAGKTKNTLLLLFSHFTLTLRKIFLPNGYDGGVLLPFGFFVLRKYLELKGSESKIIKDYSTKN